MKTSHWIPKEMIAHQTKICIPPKDSLLDAPDKATRAAITIAPIVAVIVTFGDISLSFR